MTFLILGTEMARKQQRILNQYPNPSNLALQKAVPPEVYSILFASIGEA